MKGLFIKDFAYLKQNKFLYIFLIIFGLTYSVFFDNPYFVLGYYSVFAGILTIGTFNYDSLNHGMSFIFTLPTTRKQYIQEKYYLGYLLSFILCAIAFLLATFAQFKETQNFNFLNIEWFGAYFVTILLFSILLTALLIPVQVKVGGEKGQYAIFIIFGTIGICGVMIYFLSNLLNLHIERYIDQIFNMDELVLFCLFTIICIIINLFSIKISTAILKKKEF